MEMNWNGLLHRPKLHRGLGNLFGVKKNLPNAMSPYAAADGTPAAEISDVNATADGRIVQVTSEANPQITSTAFLG